mgnify:CR=1 FL=1|tara:strand:- start:19777 stop:20247 length:471 start_codon:yes stop_codon:yes gene_type:complete
MKGDNSRGLFHKFHIERTDGKSDPGEKHHGCDYFVLDLTHDQHAIPALRAYARSCAEELPLLAADLRAKLPPRSHQRKETGNRHGKFAVQRRVLYEYDSAEPIMRGMVVWHTEANFLQDSLTIWAEHPDFDPIDDGEIPPEYEATITGEKVAWRRV